MDYFEAMTPGSVAIVLVGVTMLGGAIGSFLNVVIYRLPAGLSLAHPPSRCPRCEHPIRPYDNIPVFGWILLRGKCRDCGEPISMRYPTIEAVVAMTFLVVVFFEWFGPRFGLSFGPIFKPRLHGEWMIENLVENQMTLETMLAKTGLHLMLLVTLLGVGMIEWDGARVPRKIWSPLVVVGVLLWSFFPALTVCLAWERGSILFFGQLIGVGGVVAGLVIGAILGGVDCLCLKKEQRDGGWLTLLMGALGVGLAFGSLTVMVLGAVYLPVLFIGCLLRRTGTVKRGLPYGLGWFVLVLGGTVLLAVLSGIGTGVSIPA